MIGMAKIVNPNRRINLRLPSRNLRDDMEGFAHERGQTLPAWSKATLIREMMRSEEQDIFAQQSLESLLTMQALMEAESSNAKVDAARQKARDFIKRVKNREG